MPTLHRAVLTLWLGASAVIPLGVASNALPSGSADADPVQRIEARRNDEGRYRVAQDDDDDNSGGGGGGYGGGGGNDDDDDDDRPRGGEGGFRPRGGGGGFNLNIGPLIRDLGNAARRQQQIQQQQDNARRARDAREKHERDRREAAERNKRNERARREAIERNKRIERERKEAVDRARRIQSEKDQIQKLQDQQKRPVTQPSQTPQPYTPNPTPYPTDNKTCTNPPCTPPQQASTDPDPVPPPDDCPADDFPQMRVGATTLYPYRTNIPADRNRCTGMTSNGCYLRIMNSAQTCGSKPTCVMQCPPSVPVVVPPPRQVCANPPCRPAPVVNPVCTNPPCGPEEEKKRPESTPVDTVIATPVIEEEKKRPETTPVDTVIATPVTEPDKKRPETTPVDTVIATPVTEPDRKRPETTPVDTVIATPVTEPDKKRPEATPVDTVIATPVTEPDRKRPETTPVDTVIATPVTEPDRKRPEATPVDTVIATPVTEPDKKRPETTPVDTVIATPVAYTVPARPDRTPTPDLQPWPKDKPRTEPAPPPSGFGFDDATPVCTPRGGPPVGKLDLDPQWARTITTGALSAIPKVGGALSALTKMLWKDGTNDALFGQMKDYVDQLVPELLTQDYSKHLANRVQGIRNVLDNYERETDRDEKARHLTNLRDLISNFEPDFLDDTRPPDRTIAHFVAFGMLKLGVLQERILHAKPADREARQKDLQDEIRKYEAHANKLKADMIARRVAMIHLKNGSYKVPITAPDEFGWSQMDEVKYSAAHDDACNWDSPVSHDGFDSPDTQRDVARRKDDVTKATGDAVDAILKPLGAFHELLPEVIAQREREREEADRQRRQIEFEAIERQSCRGINC